MQEKRNQNYTNNLEEIEKTQRKFIIEKTKRKEKKEILDSIKETTKIIGKKTIKNYDQIIFLGFGLVCHMAAWFIYQGDIVSGILVIIIALLLYFAHILLPPGEFKHKIESYFIQFLQSAYKKQQKEKNFEKLEKTIFRDK